MNIVHFRASWCSPQLDGLVSDQMLQHLWAAERLTRLYSQTVPSPTQSKVPQATDPEISNHSTKTGNLVHDHDLPKLQRT